ncbi:MAG: sel1 repeat family protein [Magnetococcales bacterium]|nr:sel1 repeat family protein [Magnetococcales bacterium]
MRKEIFFSVVVISLILIAPYPEAYAETKLDFWMARFGAEMGIAESQLALGEMYRKGEVVRFNLELATYWLQKAAEQGIPEAQSSLALMYEKGVGGWRNLGKNPVHAYAYYNLGALNGDGTAAAKRDEIGRKMKPDQIKEAQELTRQMVNQFPGMREVTPE